MEHRIEIRLSRKEVHEAITQFALADLDIGVPFERTDAKVQLWTGDGTAEVKLIIQDDTKIKTEQNTETDSVSVDAF